MLKKANAVSKDISKKFSKNYANNNTLKVSSHALYKNKIDSVAQVMPNTTSTNFNFSIEVPTLAVTNQKQSGRCWLFAGLNVLREKVAAKCNLEQFELSQSYMSFWDKFEKCNWFLECMIDLADKDASNRTVCWVIENILGDGGQWDMFVNLVDKYGVVPKSAMPETANSSNTKTLNQLLITKLTQGTANLRNLVADKKDAAKIQKEKESILQDIYNILCASFGEPPKKFDFEYTNKKKKYHIDYDLTPQTFFTKYVGVNLQDYISLINSPTEDKPFNQTYTVDYLGNVVGGKDILYYNLPMKKLKKLIIETLKAGEPVWFGSDVSYYGDREGGIWDDASFDYNSLFSTNFYVSKTDGLNYRYSVMNHAMLITGVSLDKNGEPTKWKIENSWSDASGKKGYYIMSSSWFDKFVYQAVINKNLLSKEQQADIAKKPIHLDPWDPMGTLALCK